MPALQLGEGIQEPVGRDEFDVRSAGPTAEHFAQHAGNGGLADRHGTRDADHEGRALGLLAKEGGRGGMKLL